MIDFRHRDQIAQTCNHGGKTLDRRRNLIDLREKQDGGKPPGARWTEKMHPHGPGRGLDIRFLVATNQHVNSPCTIMVSLRPLAAIKTRSFTIRSA